MQNLSRERIAGALNEMLNRRDQLLDEYLTALESPGWTNQESLMAIDKAGRLHDCDKHITNLNMELKRLEVTHG